MGSSNSGSPRSYKVPSHLYHGKSSGYEEEQKEFIAGKRLYWIQSFSPKEHEAGDKVSVMPRKKSGWRKAPPSDSGNIERQPARQWDGERAGGNTPAVEASGGDGDAAAAVPVGLGLEM